MELHVLARFKQDSKLKAIRMILNEESHDIQLLLPNG